VRIAGVRLQDGSVVWLDAGSHGIRQLDRAIVRLAAGEVEGAVFVTPEAMLSPPPRVDGLVVKSWTSSPPDRDCNFLPGSEFPVLGERVRSGDLEGTVVALDPVERRVTFAHGTDETSVVPLEDLSGE
jgi:hypothetical protein